MAAPPKVGDQVFTGEKALANRIGEGRRDIYSPINGEVKAINEKIMDDPTASRKILRQRVARKNKVEPGLDARPY